MLYLLLIALLYGCLAQFYMKTWGVSPEEHQAKMPGDQYFTHISSTRGIRINASKEAVWSVAIQLGADRKGFFSYELIERLLGYIGGQRVDYALDMPIGREIPGSLEPHKSFIKYSWTVLASQAYHYFVLSNWGTFLIQEVDASTSKLIVRTNTNRVNFIDRIRDIAIFPFHFIMERKMLIGIKELAESRFAEMA